jgi:4-hydroxy-tetrahydrodipicolinate synthase
MSTISEFKKTKKISGVISALPTPFYKSEVDFESLEKMLHFQIKNGIDGFVVNGTTAESPTLTWNEVEKIFKTVKKISGDDRPIILGTGSNSTQHTIETTQKAGELGADAALVVVPYYNKPPQRGLDLHFSAVAEKTKIPLIMYNVPGRTITSIAHETILNLSSRKNICGIKEASGDIEFDQKLKKELKSDFTFLSGDDPTYISFLKLGGNGVISVMSNLLTAECERWTNAASQKNWNEAEADFAKYKELIQLMFVEANPIPIKWMLFKMGLFKSPEARLPLVALDEKFYAPIEKQMKSLGLI